MIKTITFPTEGVGYIYDHIDEPEKPDRCYRPYTSMSQDEYKKAYNKYYREHKKWEKVKDQYKLPNCHNNLCGKTFKFDDKKVNLIFGPNGSGKSTILKAIAGNAFCIDGFSKIFDPIEFKNGWGEELTMEHVLKKADELKKNTCTVVWDGAPIYYDNFERTEKEGYSMIGGYEGDLLSMQEEFSYRMGSPRVSAGQKGMYLLSKILRLSKTPCSLEDIVLRKAGDISRMNDTWANCRRRQFEYIAQFEHYSDKVPFTFLFDELDKSLDIPSVYKIYAEFFPEFVEKSGCQIITVSHNPLVLSKQIFDSENYNIISIDNEYTNEVRELLSKEIQF